MGNDIKGLPYPKAAVICIHLCMAIMAVWSESKLMKPYPAGSPVNLFVITLRQVWGIKF